MFKSIKLRIMKGRQLNPFATAKVLQEHEDRLTALEEGADSSSDEIPSLPPSRPGVPDMISDIKITVTDGTNAIEHATVAIGARQSSTTGSAGGCTIKDVVHGEYDMAVIAAGYVHYLKHITVDLEHTSFEVVLTAEV